VNTEVDVLVFVQSGAGQLTIDGTVRRFATDHIAMIPKGARRSISAGPAGVTYLSVHRRRDPLAISTRQKSGDSP